ncbi:4-(cytidine 5'-diphospho)-2-C-methyl-D-erythritol kinase [Ilumatobacter sp.]|uniref:4-(cytidine 5'-diphospho)-2-C-methyl-D-erythritol kinase n=1 Tax=Ilumatobacter sp. TaxID=1967498 RepID=UPI003AF9A406
MGAPAKLTLSLRITGVRADGFHLIDAEMVTLSFGDVLTFADGPTSLTARGPYAAGMPLDGSNLVAAALDAAGRSAHVDIDKRIPHGGGLGGGSADAAAVLRWAGWSPTPAALERAARLGADVPFCLVGGRARVRGIGEIVEPLPELLRTVTLVIPPLRVSTPAAYAAWDELGGPTAPGPNDLEPAAIAVEPELARWRDLIGDATGRSPVLAGSGATWFVHGEHDNALAALGNEGAQIVVAETTRDAGDHDG